MITIILIKKIASLFLVMLAGTALVKAKLLKPEDSRIFQVCLLYLMFPCMIITAFQIDYDPAIKDGLLLSIIASIGVHILLFILVAILSRPLHLTPVEQAPAIYSNAGNLIIPLVIAMLGPEWVIYCSGFMRVMGEGL